MMASAALAVDLTPKNESRIAVIGCTRSINVAALEVGDLDEAVLRGFGMVALNLCKKMEEEKNIILGFFETDRKTELARDLILLMF